MIKIMLNKKIYVVIILTLLFFSCQSTSSAIKGEWVLMYDSALIKAVENDRSYEELLELKEMMAQKISESYVFEFLESELKLTIKSAIDNISHVNTIASWDFDGEKLTLSPSIDSKLFKESTPWDYSSKSKWKVSFKEKDMMILTSDIDTSYVLTFKRLESSD